MICWQDLEGKPFEIPHDEALKSRPEATITTTINISSIRIPVTVATRRRSAGTNNKRRIPAAESVPDHTYHAASSSSSCKKRRTSEADSVLDDEDDEEETRHLKYLERRRKNNAASKRSRETKKCKLVDMELQAVDLEKTNDSLRSKIGRLQHLTALMKSLLVHRVARS